MQWSWLVLFLCLSASAIASSTDCQVIGPGERLCTTVHRHFSGAMVVRDWLRDAESLPSQRIIEGARAGALLIGKASLRRNEKQQWVVSLPGQDGVLLLDPADTPPSKPVRIHETGHAWEITVMAVSVPRTTPGVATEDEIKLTLRIVRADPGPRT
jgi:hypothetical protein